MAETLKQGIQMFLIANPQEFEIERKILDALVTPWIRQFVLDEYNLEFMLVDPECTMPGLVAEPSLLAPNLKYLQECFQASNGPACLIFLGEKLGGPDPPPALSKEDYQEILTNLKSKNHPCWVIFQNKYRETTVGGEAAKVIAYHLDTGNLSTEESEGLMNGIQFAANMSVEAGSRTAEAVSVFTQSYLEQMLRAGLKSRSQVDKSLALIRRIKNRDELAKSHSNQMADERALYLDVDSKQQVRPEAGKKMDELRDLVQRRLPKANSLTYSIPTSVLRSIGPRLASRLRTKAEEALSGLAANSDAVSGAQLLQDSRSDYLTNEQYVIQVAINLFLLIRSHVTRIVKKVEFLTQPLLVELCIHRHLFDRIDEPAAANWLCREREMRIVDSYLTSAASVPGLFFGDSGSGKSCLLAYARRRIDALLQGKAGASVSIVVLRSCGHTASSSTLQLLLTSLSNEIAYQHRATVERSCEYATCVYDFWRALKRATPKRPIVLLLDDVELLYPQTHVEFFRWLPHKLPPNVKILLTTSSEAVLAGFKRRYDDTSTITVPGLDVSTLLKHFPTVMAERGKLVDENSRQAANVLFQQNSSPLYMRLLAAVLPHPEGTKLPEKTRFLFGMKIAQLEQEHEAWLIKYCLGFLALSRFGLSLNELVDLLSLENAALQECGVRFKEVDYVRIPPRKVLTLLRDASLKEYVHTMPLDQRVLFTLKAETYRLGIVEYYQLSKESGVQLRQSLSDYWLGRYGGGRSKPMVDKQNDSNNGGADEPSKTLNIDRITPLHPYYWRPSLDKLALHSNSRKMTELPLQLLRGERLNDLFRYILFSLDFMYAKIVSTSVNDLISELYFIRQAYEVKNNQEVDVLITLLRHLAPILEVDPTLLGVELAGRLTHLVGKHQQLTVLHQQIDTQAPRINCLLPSIPCYPLVEAEALQVSLGPANCGMLVALSPDSKFLSTLQPSTDNDIVITVWEAKAITKSQIVNIGTHRTLQFRRMFYMPQRDEYLAVEYSDNSSKLSGFLLVNLDYGLIENKLTFPSHQGMRLLATAKSYIILHVNGGARVYQHSTGQLVKELSDLPWPFVITPSDKYLIASRSRPAGAVSATGGSVGGIPVLPPIGDDTLQRRSAAAVDNSLRLINLSNGELLCSLELQHHATSLQANIRNEVLFVGCRGQGLICRFEISQVTKRDVRKLKPSSDFSLDSPTAFALLTGETLHVYSRLKGATFVSQLLLSPDDKYLLALYEVSDMRRFYLVWHLANKVAFCLIPKRDNDVVRFNGDVNQVYQFTPHSDKAENGAVFLYNLSPTGGAATSTVEEIKLTGITRDLFLLKGGTFVTVTDENITLTTLKHMEEQSVKTAQDLSVQSYCTALTSPQYNRELNVIYSNDLKTSDFSYFNLDTNLLFTVDMSHSFTSMTKNPKERYISPDGTKLIMVYGSQHSEEMKKRSKASPNDFLLPLNGQGKIINGAGAYRKPEIPNVNYFTGTMNAAKAKKLENTASLRVASDITQRMFEQRILRVFDLNTCSLVCQISLTGERVLQLTNKVLLTFKPDYASITRSAASNANDIVSIYDVCTGVYVNSIYLEHPVVASGLVDNNTKMIVSCGKNGKWLKLLGGKEHFDKVLHELDIDVMMKWYDEFARGVIVKDMLIFRQCVTSVLLNYTWKETDFTHYYAKIDMLKKDVESHFEAESRICDVTGDGQLAVDQLLNIYDLNRGECIRSVGVGLTTDWAVGLTPTLSISPSDIPNKQAKFTDDALFVVVVDNVTRQLVVVHNNPKAELLGKALLHPVRASRTRVEEWENYAISLGQGGRIIVLHNSVEFKVFILKEAFRSGAKRAAEAVYKNLRDRVRYLMPHKIYNSIDKAFKNLSTTQNDESSDAGGDSKQAESRLKTRSRRDGGLSRDSGIASPTLRKTADTVSIG